MSDPRHLQGVVEIDQCSTVSEFLDLLNPWNSKWNKPFDNCSIKDWVFRGHSDSNWKLIPSAFREEALERFPILTAEELSNYFDSWPSYEVWHASFEARLITQFHRVSIENGNPLPADSITNHFELEMRWAKWFSDACQIANGKKEGELENWPFRDLLPIIGLAQHHGIPTRLLDWSRSPSIAGFFAASGASKWALSDQTPDGATTLGVWCASRYFFDATYRFDPNNPASIHEKFLLFSIPIEYNSNIVAQKGEFSIVESDFHPTDILDVIPLDEKVRKVFQSEESSPTGPWMRLITLPIEKAPELLLEIDRCGVNAATVFPGFDGVVSFIQQQAKLSVK